MIVFNLHCHALHRFEGWFRSPEDYLEQREREVVACPVCASTRIERLPSAPRLNLASAAEPTDNKSLPAGPGGQSELAAGLRQMRALLARAENVGERFAEEARRIHYEEAPARPIRGQATRGEYLELVDEGIGALPLPPGWPPEGELN